MAQKNILIVEDESPMAKALKLKLEKDGLEVTIAENGEAGIKQLDEKAFDLVICDLMMPVVDGFEVLKHIRENEIDTIVIVASNLSQTEDIQKARDMGARDYFVKSDTPIVSIVSQVQSLLESE